MVSTVCMTNVSREGSTTSISLHLRLYRPKYGISLESGTSPSCLGMAPRQLPQSVMPSMS